jgi:hypothetical protein
MAEITLYNFPQSTCSQKVRLAMWEKGIPYTDHIVMHKEREHLSDWYLKLNPNGVVPTFIGHLGIHRRRLHRSPDVTERPGPEGAYAEMDALSRRSADPGNPRAVFQSASGEAL